jgi:two-component system sensor histidine kinase KdpD
VTTTPRPPSPVREYGLAITIVVLAGAVALAFRDRLMIIDAAMMLLLAAVVAAAFTRRGPAVVAAIASIVLFDVWFVPPYNRVTVDDSAYVLTFAVMFVVALIMGGLTARIREHVIAARERAGKLGALYSLTRELSAAPSREEVILIGARHLEQATGARAVILLSGIARAEPPEPPQGSLVIPLDTSGMVSGIVVLDPAPASEEIRSTARLFADQVSGALDRIMLVERTQRAQVEVESERLRTALLSSLSHDLRTPLAGIEGAASSLLESGHELEKPEQEDLARDILAESRRMNRLVGNLLDMVRVESGTLALRKEWLPLEEPVGVALLRLEEKLGGRPVEVRLPEDLPFVPMDELLIEQVLINLLENAIRYTPPGTPVTISARNLGSAVELEIADRGPGLPAGQEEAVFQKFYRGTTAGSPATNGAGLGLAICRGIIQAHGGTIRAIPLESGALFRFNLPLDGTPPPAPTEE